jgi:hypothetical protein
LPEVLKAVATGMRRFEGGTTKEFWAWCYLTLFYTGAGFQKQGTRGGI